ncbi:hypothetical protein diail_448 [Diaporthe ilicicola]|nr:hypothetical protein diail_448 [Diaporthe ilicicola]
MADPFLIATGAFGIVTFGIQVCGGVLKYLSAVRHRHKELAAAWDTARTLAVVLERLNGFITRIHADKPEHAALLSQCLEGARVPLLELRNVVAKLEGFPEGVIPTLQNAAGLSLSTTTRSAGPLRKKAKNAGRAMAYKFHQDDVRDLRVALQQLTTSLNTAILTVDLNENEQQGQNIKSLQNSVSSIGLNVESEGADIRSAIDSLAFQNQATAFDLQPVAHENASRLRKLQDGLSSELSLIKRQISMTEEAVHDTSLEAGLLRAQLRAEFRDELQAHAQAMLAQFRTIASQPKQQNPSDTGGTEAPQLADRVARYLPPASLKQALDTFSRCRCRASTARSATSYLQLHGFSAFSREQRLSRHRRGCPLYVMTQEHTRAVGARVRIQLGSFLSCLVDASFECSMGAGGSSCGPSREFSSVGFWLPSGERKREAAEVVDRLETMQKNVLLLYQKGEASINDIDEQSNNHLQLYVETGLTCDERDTYYVTTAASSQPGFSPLIETSTTLAKSASLLFPFGGRASDQSVRLVASIIQASDPLIEDVVRVMPYVDPGMENVTPLVRAILLRSLDDLKSAIRLSLESLLVKTDGLTVLYLSVGWPLGLSFLLETDARLLLDTPDNSLENGWGSRANRAWPFSYAAANHCAESLDLVLQAGCDLYPAYPQSGRMSQALAFALEATSAECAEVFARHMARRRNELFALARSNLDKIRVHLSAQAEDAQKEVMAAIRHSSGPNAPDSDAKQPVQQMSEQAISNIMTVCLERAKIPIPLPMRPAKGKGQNIYQLPGLPLEFFPIFERNGFVGYGEPNQHGLRPIMDDWRSYPSLSKPPLGEAVQDVLPWLIEHRCLDAKPVHMEKQPYSDIKINTGATGWHYLSMKMVTSTWCRQSADFRAGWTSEASVRLMTTIAEEEANRHRDGFRRAIFSHPDPEGERRRLGADPFEADKARQLEELMAEFAEQLGRRTGSPRDLEDFIFGSWRARMGRLYDVNNQEVEAMENLLGCKVRTKILPEPLQKFFGDKFSFFDNIDNASGSTRISPSKVVSMDKKPLYYVFCF